MTMWLSGKIISPGFIKINHIQRGFPIKEVYGSRKKQVDILRKDLRKTTISPNVKNIFSEKYLWFKQSCFNGEYRKTSFGSFRRGL